jgi:hypothetical protein
MPFSLSTLSTTTTSFRPTRINFWIDRIRRRESSDNRIIPSMLSYSSCESNESSWARQAPTDSPASHTRPPLQSDEPAPSPARPPLDIAARSTAWWQQRLGTVVAFKSNQRSAPKSDSIRIDDIAKIHYVTLEITRPSVFDVRSVHPDSETENEHRYNIRNISPLIINSRPTHQ